MAVGTRCDRDSEYHPFGVQMERLHPRKVSGQNGNPGHLIPQSFDLCTPTLPLYPLPSLPSAPHFSIATLTFQLQQSLPGLGRGCWVLSSPLHTSC